MTPIGKRRREITEKISEAASNIGTLTATSLLIACVALLVSFAALVTVRRLGHAR